MIIALFAIDDNGAMGYQGTMPWPRNREDMMWFKKTTQHHTVVMGKNTWTSSDMPIPLPNRTNVLISNNFIENEDVIQLRGDLCEGLKHLEQSQDMEKIFVIGGPNILMQALPVIERAYITRIPGEYLSDTNIDMKEFLKDFTLVGTTNLESCTIEEYEK